MIFNQTYVSPPYAPLIWNDTGKYNYFYVDFKKTLSPFSMDMFVESILVYGTAPITITALEKINATTYKVYADITGLIHGLVVMSKSPTRLKLSTGKELPAFSTFMFVSGVASYIDGGYIYETIPQPVFDLSHIADTPSADLWEPLDGGSVSESITLPVLNLSNIAEAPSIVLT